MEKCDPSHCIIAAPESPVGIGHRLIGLLLAIGIGTVLYVATRLEPSSAGLGTHLQLGLPLCSSPIMTGYPCPTCGMTTSMAHAVRGQFLASARAHPAGLALFAGMIFGLGLSLRTAISGAHVPLFCKKLTPLYLGLGTIGILLFGWGFNIVRGLVDGTLPFGR